MLVKANSLIYSLYVCLIVAIFCGGLLYYFSLYERLDDFYETQQELILKNRSFVNYILGTAFEEKELDIKQDIDNQFELKKFGGLTYLLTKVFNKNDTISDCNFIGISEKNTGIYVPEFSKAVSFSGKVNIFGNAFLPGASLTLFNSNELNNKLEITGKLLVSNDSLPSIKTFSSNLNGWLKTTMSFEESNIEFADSLLLNSFFKRTRIFKIKSSIINNIKLKGNFVIKNNDSIVVSKNCILEDVVLVAPVIIIENGFTGTIQALGTKKIIIGTNCELKYPSIVGLNNKLFTESKLLIGEKSIIKGLVINYGNDMKSISNHELIIGKNVKIYGIVFNSGTTMVGGEIFGSVFTNRVFYKDKSVYHENLIQNVSFMNGDDIPNLISVQKSNGKLKYVCIKKNF